MKLSKNGNVDEVFGAKAIGEIIGETPRQTFSLMQRKLVPCWKNGGRYAASRRELQEYLAGAYRAKAEAIGEELADCVSRKEAALATADRADVRMIEILNEGLVQRRIATGKFFKALGFKRTDDGDDYKSAFHQGDYIPPVTLLAQDFARVLADESFPRELWERHHRAETPNMKEETPTL